MIYTIPPYDYLVDGDGVVRQLNPDPDPKVDYRSKYNAIAELTTRMAFLRWGIILGLHRFGTPLRVLDVGYGNGAFLELATQFGIEALGSDLNPYPLPSGTDFIPLDQITAYQFDVVTFFDSLEHFDNLDFLSELQADCLVITAPCCHWPGQSIDWFASWKHRRPNEHLWHFNPISLARMLARRGWREFWSGSPEDVIRTPEFFFLANTFTSAFRKIETLNHKTLN